MIKGFLSVRKRCPLFLKKKRLSLSLLFLSKLGWKVENGSRCKHLAPPVQFENQSFLVLFEIYNHRITPNLVGLNKILKLFRVYNYHRTISDRSTGADRILFSLRSLQKQPSCQGLGVSESFISFDVLILFYIYFYHIYNFLTL